MIAKRYTYGASQGNNVCGITFLLAHCIGSRQYSLRSSNMISNSRSPDKEQWEPTLERMSSISLLCLTDLKVFVPIYDWALAVSAFVRSPQMAGHHIVPLGHSAGAGAMMLTTRGILLSELPYAALVLIEPTMIPEDLSYAHFDDRMANMAVMVGATSLRRDT
ncbi:hypothetical protein BDZ89DRAFT_1233477 [Hymenopellis radicata]|nr:hypothetical protein BDZ89DRAFT_1233477 [Hymenopellis radicata]